MINDPEVEINKILDGFDPENNEQDRRILYEVMGMRLYRDEFKDRSSSDSGEDEDEGLYEI